MRGSLSGSDVVGRWRFRTNAISQFFANISGLSLDASVERSLQDIRQQTLLRSNQLDTTQFVRSDRLPVETYFLTVINWGLSRTSYNLFLSAAPVAQAQFASALPKPPSPSPSASGNPMVACLMSTQISTPETACGSEHELQSPHRSRDWVGYLFSGGTQHRYAVVLNE